MEKRNLPGIPQSFLEIFFSTSNNIEELVRELDEKRVNIESVNRWLEILKRDFLSPGYKNQAAYKFAS